MAIDEIINEINWNKKGYHLFEEIALKSKKHGYSKGMVINHAYKQGLIPYRTANILLEKLNKLNEKGLLSQIATIEEQKIFEKELPKLKKTLKETWGKTKLTEVSKTKEAYDSIRNTAKTLLKSEGFEAADDYLWKLYQTEETMGINVQSWGKIRNEIEALAGKTLQGFETTDIARLVSGLTFSKAKDDIVKVLNARGVGDAADRLSYLADKINEEDLIKLNKWFINVQKNQTLKTNVSVKDIKGKYITQPIQTAIKFTASIPNPEDLSIDSLKRATAKRVMTFGKNNVLPTLNVDLLEFYADNKKQHKLIMSEVRDFINTANIRKTHLLSEKDIFLADRYIDEQIKTNSDIRVRSVDKKKVIKINDFESFSNNSYINQKYTGSIPGEVTIKTRVEPIETAPKPIEKRKVEFTHYPKEGHRWKTSVEYPEKLIDTTIQEKKINRLTTKTDKMLGFFEKTAPRVKESIKKGALVAWKHPITKAIVHIPILEAQLLNDIFAGGKIPYIGSLGKQTQEIAKSLEKGKIPKKLPKLKKYGGKISAKPYAIGGKVYSNYIRKPKFI